MADDRLVSEIPGAVVPIRYRAYMSAAIAIQKNSTAKAQYSAALKNSSWNLGTPKAAKERPATTKIVTRTPRGRLAR